MEKEQIRFYAVVQVRKPEGGFSLEFRCLKEYELEKHPMRISHHLPLALECKKPDVDLSSFQCYVCAGSSIFTIGGYVENPGIFYPCEEITDKIHKMDFGGNNPTVQVHGKMLDVRGWPVAALCKGKIYIFCDSRLDYNVLEVYDLKSGKAYPAVNQPPDDLVQSCETPVACFVWNENKVVFYYGMAGTLVWYDVDKEKWGYMGSLDMDDGIRFRCLRKHVLVWCGVLLVFADGTHLVPYDLTEAKQMKVKVLEGVVSDFVIGASFLPPKNGDGYQQQRVCVFTGVGGTGLLRYVKIILIPKNTKVGSRDFKAVVEKIGTFSVGENVAVLLHCIALPEQQYDTAAVPQPRVQ